MIKSTIFKTIILAVISIAAAASLLGCGPEKTAQPLRTFTITPTEETTPVQSASATPGITITKEPQTTADATSSATVTAPAGDPVDATSSATVKGGEGEEDDD